MRHHVIALAAVGVVLAGCGAGESGPECVPVPEGTVDAVAGGDTYSFEPTGRAGAVHTGGEGYVVAVEAAGLDGEDPVIGTYWMPDLVNPGPITTVDATAELLTNWPAGPVPNGHETVRQAERCLTG